MGILNFFGRNLVTASFWPELASAALTWAIWLVLMICTGIGVAINLVVFPPTATLNTTQVWLVTVVIVLAMNNLTYAGKFSNGDSRHQLSPVEVGQYVIQGFGWAATWPALAQLMGSAKIDPASAVTMVSRLFG